MLSPNYTYNVCQRIEEVVDANPKHVFLQYPEGNSISYGLFWEMVGHAANYLQYSGLQKGDVLAILNQKSPWALATMVGALKLGVIYTNLDPKSPEERLKRMLSTAEPKLILIDGLNSNKRHEWGVELKSIDDIKNWDNKSYTSNEDIDITGEDAAYIMFTSGSTGFPKGAVMSHDNLLNLGLWAGSTFNLTSSDKLTNVNPIYFDNSVFDFYAALLNGSTLVPFTVEQTKDPKFLIQNIDERKCTFWFSVPSMLIYLLTTKVLNEDSFKSVSQIAFGGEGFPKNKLKKLFNLFNNRKKLYNVYGPTECTCICSSYLISEDDFKDMDHFAPLGNLAPNFDYIIIDSPKEAKKGELCLIGPNVGLGYYNDVERTNQSFVQNPTTKFRQLMYKTGDLVFFNEKDSKLYIKGRVDNQIKHMGYRIELEEVESGLNRLEGVKESAALYHNLQNGMGMIIGFIAGELENEEKLIKEKLRTYLPEYMIPKKIITINVLPKNANGKIDKLKLKEQL